MLMRYRGDTYDVAKFAARHPGGAKVLAGLRDADIDGYLDGNNETETGERHEHSKAAYAILKKYAVKVERTFEADVIDWDKPIMFQVGFVGKSTKYKYMVFSQALRAGGQPGRSVLAVDPRADRRRDAPIQARLDGSTHAQQLVRLGAPCPSRRVGTRSRARGCRWSPSCCTTAGTRWARTSRRSAPGSPSSPHYFCSVRGFVKSGDSILVARRHPRLDTAGVHAASARLPLAAEPEELQPGDGALCSPRHSPQGWFLWKCFQKEIIRETTAS